MTDRGAKPNLGCNALRSILDGVEALAPDLSSTGSGSSGLARIVGALGGSSSSSDGEFSSSSSRLALQGVFGGFGFCLCALSRLSSTPL